MRQYYRTTNSELYHHGIKGMKWGIRRYQNKDGSLTSAGRKRNMSEDHKVAHDLKKRKLSSLSNKELKTVNERMNLEANYKDLKNNRNASIGKKFVEKAIAGAAVAGVTIAVGNRIRKGTQVATDKVIDTAIEIGKKYMKHSETDEVDDFLMHHGIKGQKWGVRRYQNEDGTLTAKGQKKYASEAKQQKLKNEWHQQVMSNQYQHTNRQKVLAKMDEETKQSKEFKDMSKRNGRPITIRDGNGRVVKTSLSYVHSPNFETTMKWIEEDTKIEKAFSKKQNDIMKKYLDEFTGATLKDLGYKDTKQGREYLKKIGIVSA